MLLFYFGCFGARAHCTCVCIWAIEVWDVARLKKYKQNPNPLRVSDLIYPEFCRTWGSIYLECQVLGIESNFFLWQKRKWRVIPKGILVADATASSYYQGESCLRLLVHRRSQSPVALIAIHFYCDKLFLFLLLFPISSSMKNKINCLLITVGTVLQTITPFLFPFNIPFCKLVIILSSLKLHSW